jgi:hypothetical protein
MALQLLAVGALVSFAAAAGRGPAAQDAFLGWCAARNISLSPSVRVDCSTPDQCGLFASSDMPAGAWVMRVPIVAMINVEHALTEPTSHRVWGSDFMNEERELDLMAAFLVWQTAIIIRAKGGKGKRRSWPCLSFFFFFLYFLLFFSPFLFLALQRCMSDSRRPRSQSGGPIWHSCPRRRCTICIRGIWSCFRAPWCRNSSPSAPTKSKRFSAHREG